MSNDTSDITISTEVTPPRRLTLGNSIGRRESPIAPSKTINTDRTQDNTGRSIKVFILIAENLFLQQKYVIDTYDDLNGVSSRKFRPSKRLTTYYFVYS